MDSDSTNHRYCDIRRKNGLFEALSHSTRRRVLRYLDDADGPTTVPRLAAHLTACDRTGAVAADRRQQTLVSLVHVHLPKLQSAGLVDWTGDEVSLSVAATLVPLSRPLTEGLLSASMDECGPK